MDFTEMFRDQRWHDRKKALLEAAEWVCAECKYDVDEDAVHICLYPKGMMVWNYPARAFKVLCPSHREERAWFERQLRELLPDFATSDFGVFLDALDQLRKLDGHERSRSMEELRAAVTRGAEMPLLPRDRRYDTA